MGPGNSERFVEALRKASDKIKALLDANAALKAQGAIAVVGMGCRFPGGAESPQRFWELLAQERDAVGTIPPSRFDVARWWDADPSAAGRIYVKDAALIDDVRGFDPSFFKITPAEAESLDPQQRLLLEVSWETFEDAGIDVRRIRGSRTGVYIGLSNYDYIQAHIHSGDPSRITAHSGSGVMFGTASGRLSYFYDLHGPCLTLDTACSSSLVALDAAIKALRRRECDAALAGGISLLLSPASMVALCKVSALAADGRSRAFDDQASGYGRGEGCGLLLLKRLDDALRDGDMVHAVLSGSAVNHDGSSNGLTAPNGLAQQAVIRAALEDAELTPDAIDYVEAHGTGTPLGDPIEFGALQSVFGQGRTGHDLLLGSVKTNIGHTEAAAGIAGVIKAILALRHGVVPRSLHFTTPNHHIDWAAARIRVAASATPWPAGARPRAAGVSAFGLSGTNAHIIVSETPAPPESKTFTSPRPAFYVLPLSATTRPALEAARTAWSARIEQAEDPELASLCAAAARRTPLNERTVAIADDAAGLVSALRQPLPARPRSPDAGAPVFLFGGTDSLAPGMGRGLYAAETVFRDAFDLCAAAAGADVGATLTGLIKENGIIPPTAAPAMTFALQWAMAALWASWGVRPTAVAGDGVGEYTAAATAGVFDPAIALQLIRADSPQSDGGDFRAQLPIYSGRTGALVSPGTRLDASYWRDTARGPSRFDAAIRAMRRDGRSCFVDIGPGDALTTRAIAAGAEIAVTALKSCADERRHVAEQAAALWRYGIEVDWTEFCGPRSGPANAPNYPFQRKPYWLELGLREPDLRTTDITEAAPGAPQHEGTQVTRSEMRVTALVNTVAAITGFEPAEIASAQRLMDLGLDSLMLLKLGQTIARDYGVELRISQLFKELNTIDAITAYLDAHAPSTSDSAKPVAVQASSLDEAAAPVAIAPTAAPGAVSSAPVSLQPAGVSADLALLFQQQLDAMTRMAAQNLQSLAALTQQQLAAAGASAAVATNASPPSPAAMPAPAKAAAPLLQQAAEKPTAPRPAAVPVAAIRGINIVGTRLTEQQKQYAEQLVQTHSARTGRSKALTQSSRAVLADWKHTLSFWGQLKEAKYPIVSAASEGARFTDLDGNVYIDVAMGMGVHFFGHKPEFIHAALERQMAAGLELGTQSPLTGATAQLLTEMTGTERVAFSNTGSEAVMVGLRLARAATGRSKIVIFKGAYHGIFDGVLAAESEGEIVPIGLGTPTGMVEDVVLLDYGSESALDYVRRHGATLAAVLMEPVQSRNPDLQPQRFLSAMRRLTRDSGTALIFDEMINGFRAAPGGAQQWFGIDADIVLFGKIAGGGMPIGVIAGKAQFLDYIDGGNWDYGDRSGPTSPLIYFGGTFCRNPTTIVAAHAALTHIKAAGPALQESVTALTTAFCDRLNFWLECHRLPLRAKSFSSQWRLVPLGGDGKEPFELELLYLAMMVRGVYTWERRISFFSAAHGRPEADAVFEAITAGIAEIRAAGFNWSIDLYPEPQFSHLTSLQRRLFALSQRDNGQRPYHLPQAFIVDGPLDIDRLEDAFRQIIARHESLRTAFVSIDGEPLAKRLAEPRFSIERSAIDTAASDDDALNAIIARFLRPFDLGLAPLLRVMVAPISDGRHLLLADTHHIVVDGLSFDIIAAELMAAYQDQKLPPIGYDLQLALRDSSAGLEGARGEANAAFWRSQVQGLPSLALPSDHPRPSEPDFCGDTLVRTLSAETTTRLKALGRQDGASLYMVLLAAWSGFLYRLTGQGDIAVGGVTSGRELASVVEAVGMFVNTVVFRLQPEAQLPFALHLANVVGICIAAYDHGDYPFEAIVELNGAPPPGRNPVFDTMLSYEDASARIFEIDQLRFTRHEVQTGAAMFDLSLNAMEERGALTLYFNFATALFERATIEHWAGAFIQMLNAILDDPQQPICCLDIQTPEDRRLIAVFNDTAADYPREATLVDLFDEAAARYPDRIALVDGEASLTYRELDQRSEALAGAITARTRPGDLVGVLLSRSHRIPIAELAIMKAGCVFVPLDPGHPPVLLAHILSDSGCALILTEPEMQSRQPRAYQDRALDISSSDSHPRRRPGHDETAYVIYTSGSQGKPKGCFVSHRNAVRLLVNSRFPFSFGPDDVWVCAHSFTFDFSIWEVWGAWAYGGRVVVASSDEARDPAALLSLVRQHRVTVLNQTPAAFHGFADAEQRRPAHDLADHLRTVILGGDRLEPAYLRPWAALYPLGTIAVVNMYGITETTVHVTFHRLDDLDLVGRSSVIGRPLPETTIDVLNPAGLPQPVGVPGEMWVGGSGVCLGYRNSPELTAERFVAIAGQRRYRTGDIGRLRSDGRLEYIARNDHQVQVRGHRVELEGIQHALIEHPRVDKAVVTSRDTADNDRELIAYVIGDPALTVAELRDHLAQRLPFYAIPAHFVALTAFPVTFNGKLDHTRLPSPDAVRMPAGGDDTGPRNAIEATIAAVWAEVLGLPHVGIDQNYYALGGDSIKALQIVSRLHRTGIAITLAQLLSAKTVLGVAALAGNAGIATKPSHSDTAPLTAVQRWLLDTHGAAPGRFNNAVLLAAGRVNVAALNRAVAALVAHHEALRLSIDLSVTPPVQRTEPDLPVLVETVEIAESAALTAHATAAQRAFDISTPPLLRVVHYRLPGDDRILLLCHHLVIDAVSWRILLEDFVTAYEAALAGRDAVLQPTSLPWLEWAMVQQRAARSPDLLSEIPYWRSIEKADVAPLPCDFTDPVNAMADACTLSFEFDADVTRRLLAFAARTELGMDAVLLAALAHACRTCFGLERIRVRLEGHGREAFEPNVDPTRTVGWFTSIFPVIFDSSGAKDFEDMTRRTAEALSQTPRKGAGYGILRYLTPEALKPDLTFGPWPELGFNYLGQFDTTLGGLFRLAEEPTGATLGETLRRPELIECEALITNGRLAVTLGYGERLHRRSTIEQLAQSMREILGAPAFSPLPLRAPLKAADAGESNAEAVLALSPLQEGMLFHALSGDRQSYVQQFTYRLSGAVDLDILTAAYQHLAARHQALRAAIVTPPGEASRQIILKTRPLPIEIVDLRGIAEAEQITEVEALGAAALASGFNLARDPLMRLILVRLGPDAIDVISTNHHIILDGWSVAILHNELMATYAALARGQQPLLPPAPPLRRHLDWLASRDSNAARRFWTQRLADAPPPASIPGLDANHRLAGHAMAEHLFAFDETVTSSLTCLTAKLEVTLNSVVQGLWAVLLAGYAGSDDVIFGTIASGRPSELPDIERMVGLFLQPIPVRARLSHGGSFADLARQLQRDANESEPFHFLPLAEMQTLRGRRQILFEHVLIFENYPFATQDSAIGLETSHLRAIERTHYDFSIVVHPGPELQVQFTYNANVLSTAEFVRIEAQMRTLADAVIADAKQPLSAIDLGGNKAAVSPGQLPRGTVLDLFEAQAARSPDAIALEGFSRAISYRDLDERAETFARSLRATGVGPGTPVALFLPNDIDYVASLLAVWKAAAVFVPLDIEAPAQRLSTLVAKIKPIVFVTCSNLLDRLADRLGGLPANLASWEADGSRSDVFESKTSNRSHERPAPASAAYIMFTSGSTGEPKAILSSHEALHHFIAWECNELGAGAGLRVANLAPVTFDVSLRDIFLPLAVGGALCIPEADIRRDGQKLADWLAEQEVAVVHAVPSLFRLALTALQVQSRRLPALQHVLFAGEMLRGADVDLARRVLGDGVALRNLYGPSETTLAKCCYHISGAIDPGKAVPVGTPLPGTRVLIVKNGRLAAPGAIGELYIGVPFAPLGYAGNPALTAESFIACPEEWGGVGILYRTGDLGRELADGTIEVCGRLDGQVKINGVRVELGEIEQAVLANPEVSAAVAITHARHDGDPALVCYYTAKRALDPAKLRERLELGLPRASVPHFIVPLDTFPLGLNGKVDRRALPKPEELVTGRIPYVAPAGPAEERIAAIWGEVLGVRRIGVCTSFFEAGGDSLRAIRLLTRINSEFGSEISISGFFAKPTVRELALSVSPSAAVDAAIPTLSDAADYVTSSAQRRLWVLAQLGGNPAAYTLPAAYRIDGPLDTAALIRALEALPSRHEALRTAFVPTTDWPRQRVLPNSDFRVAKIDLRCEADPDAAARALVIQNAERGFDLETGPLFAASLLTLDETCHLLLVNVHHIVSDAVSATVMVEEILRMARGEILPPLRVQYKDYAASEATWLETPQAQTMKAWWYDELKDLPEPLNLPFDRYPEVPPSYDGARVSIRLDATPLNGLRELARQAGGTLFSGLLALTAALLQRHTGVDDMVLGTPVARRDTVEQESQVGFYVNLLPLRIALREGETAASLIASVSSVLTAAIDHRAYPFDQLVHDLGLMRDNGLPPLFDVAVVFQDSSQQGFALDGVSVSLLDIDAKIAKFPLTFEFVENADGVTLNLEYATALFDHGRIVRMAEHFRHLITAATITPAQPVASLNIFGELERALLQTSGPALDLPPEATVSAAFAAWATRQPTAPAVVCEDKQFTYSELATRMAALGRKLAREGVRRGETVAVLLERSEHLAVAFLGILEAGAVYLPLDPAYPAERIEMMLKDSAARLVLTEPRHTGQLAGTDYVAIDIHAVDTTAKKPANRSDKQSRPAPDDLAYLIFTSGSTGRPKGVLIEHRGAINLAMAQRHALGIEPRHRVLQFAPTSFDSSVWEMLMALLNGACLVVATPARAKDPAALASYLAEARVTVATLPPVYLAELDDAALAPLEILITAGEAPDAARMVRLAHSLRCVNGYGPTEATVCASMHVVDPAADPGRPIPIGRAIANMEMPVLDRWGNLAPVGVLGEIHIGGTGLARGYLDRPAQTEAAFIPHPFIAGKKLYRTGDIAFVDADGNVVFAGRSDRQIKLRGFRVELDEIERSIARSPSVAAAAVVVQQRREEAELVAFIVSDGPHDLKASKIELARSLPDFMMPSRWILRDALPSTPSGKIDYVTLSRYELESSEPSGLIDPLEVLVGNIWREILGHGDFTREDRFFAVGGDSIRAIQVTGRLKAAGYAVEMRAFLATPTIAGLAAQLSTTPLTETLAALPPVAVDLSTIEGLFSA